jgi:hypothetical protein
MFHKLQAARPLNYFQRRGTTQHTHANIHVCWSVSLHLSCRVRHAQVLLCRKKPTGTSSDLEHMNWAKCQKCTHFQQQHKRNRRGSANPFGLDTKGPTQQGELETVAGDSCLSGLQPARPPKAQQEPK